ncbi:MAG: hypothetical protein Kow0068_18350 [Marinilabiliales bacterium]
MKLLPKVLLKNTNQNSFNYIKIFYCIILSVTLISCARNESNTANKDIDLGGNILKQIKKVKNADLKREKFKKYFDSLAIYQQFNGNVLVAQYGQVIFSGEYGYSNIKTKDTLKPESTFQLASITKQFTAVAILKLYEEGKIKLNDSIQKFFPDFPYKGIKIHMLLTHRSGLTNYIYFADKLLKNKNTYLSNDFIIKAFTKYKPEPYYPPDMTFDYSNTGYAILAKIIEKVSGVSYEDFITENIFKPLSMTNSCVYNRNKNIEIPNKTTGYIYYGKPAEDNIFNGVVGDKGIYSCVEDLLKWDMSLYTDKIIKRKTKLMAFKPMGKPADERHNYGYGWRLFTTEDNIKIIYHGGWWQGYQNLFMHIEKDTTTVIILKNIKTPYAFNMEDYLKML